MVVIADTSPINYLVLIGHVDVLREIYKRVVIPQAVFDELNAIDSPDAVQRWLGAKPDWLEVSSERPTVNPALEYLGLGERQAIALAQSLRAEVLIVDELAGRREASRQGVPVIGFLGVLLEASRRHLLDLSKAIKALQATSFYMSDDLIARILELDRSVSSINAE